MKIVYLVHQFYPERYMGTERFVLHLATMMQKAGHKVKVITYSSYDDAFYTERMDAVLLKEFAYESIPVLALRHKDFRHGHLAPSADLDDEHLSQVAARVIAREAPDIVHVAHAMRVGELVKQLRLSAIPYVVTLMDFWLMCPKMMLITSKGTLCHGPESGSACQKLCPELSAGYITARLAQTKNVLFNAERVASPNRSAAEMFEREFPGLEVTTVGFGVRYGALSTNQKKYKAGDRVIFGYAGSWNEHKGVHVLIEAFRGVPNENARLEIWGTGGTSGYLDRLFRGVKGDKRIDWCGAYSEAETGATMANIDVLVVPSLWYETGPFVLLEALACNVPVIASNVGSMAEHIKDGVNGFLVRMGDPHHLKSVLQSVVDDPTILNVLKQNMTGAMVRSVEQQAYGYQRLYRLIHNQRRQDGHSGDGREPTAASSARHESVGERLGRIWLLAERMHTRRADLRFDDPHSEEFWIWMNRYGILDYQSIRELLVPLPPAGMRAFVGGGDTAEGQFLSIGAETYRLLRHVTQEAGCPLSSLAAVLDFGCGPGRTLRYLLRHAETVACTGIDVDAAAIRWCKRHFPFGEFWVNRETPPTDLKPATFDLIYAISVFSRLAEDNHRAWLNELHRLGKKDGLVVLSVSGEFALQRALKERASSARLLRVTEADLVSAAQQLSSHGYAFIRQPGLPFNADLYGVTFISKEYVRRRWGQRFEVLSHLEGALDNWQDVVVLRARRQR